MHQNYLISSRRIVDKHIQPTMRILDKIPESLDTFQRINIQLLVHWVESFLEIDFENGMVNIFTGRWPKL